uniref:Uncharacterized protein n=1 Tax=Lotharella oceanica TaxID=641309 RepID=A0A7S2U3B0_9EUKA|mmetsp:Transcript_6068/g.12154  ORF Transcript_6068/g.12154 Transcript_6068/m.12154 type:complete len:181 (+) Transcript_6068:43-585(+)
MCRWDGKLYAGGGIAGYSDMFRSVEVLDLRNVNAGWSEMPSLSRGGMLRMTAHDGKLYALSSETVERLDLSNAKAGWKTIANNDTTPSGVVITKDGKLYAICEKHGLRWLDISSSKDSAQKWIDVVMSEGKSMPPPQHVMLLKSGTVRSSSLVEVCTRQLKMYKCWTLPTSTPVGTEFRS